MINPKKKKQRMRSIDADCIYNLGRLYSISINRNLLIAPDKYNSDCGMWNTDCLVG